MLPEDADGAPAETTRYPMRVVTRRTGLTPDVLRVWERRYAVVNPVRSPGGQRLYSADDLERLRILNQLVRSGHRIAAIAKLPYAELTRLAGEVEAPAAAGSDAGAAVEEAIRCVVALDDDGLEATLRRAAISFTTEEWLTHVLAPFLLEVGERWHAGEISPAHEHLASAITRDVLAWVADSFAPRPGAPVVIVGTPSGEHHELGAMIAAIVAAESGCAVRYLGPNLPARAIGDAALQLDARAVALSVVYVENQETALRELRQLRRMLPQDVALLVGGRAADAIHTQVTATGAEYTSGNPALRAALASITAHA